MNGFFRFVLGGRAEMYVTNESTENTIAHIISIFEKDRRKPVGESDFQEINKDDEYQQVIFELWDYCDKLPLATVENAVVELEGEMLGAYDPQVQRIKTNLEQYLSVRLEQDKE